MYVCVRLLAVIIFTPEDILDTRMKVYFFHFPSISLLHGSPAIADSIAFVAILSQPFLALNRFCVYVHAKKEEGKRVS